MSRCTCKKLFQFFSIVSNLFLWIFYNRFICTWETKYRLPNSSFQILLKGNYGSRSCSTLLDVAWICKFNNTKATSACHVKTMIINKVFFTLISNWLTYYYNFFDMKYVRKPGTNVKRGWRSHVYGHVNVEALSSALGRMSHAMHISPVVKDPLDHNKDGCFI
jgi:hypothetical protein